MKKYLQTISTAVFVLTLLLFFGSCNHEKIVETDFYTLTIPGNWSNEEVDIAMDGVSGMQFSKSNSSNSIVDMGMIMRMKFAINPQYFLKQQVQEKANVMFANSQCDGEIEPVTFLGQEAYTLSYTTWLNENEFQGQAYTFLKDNSLYFIIYMSIPGAESEMPDILNTLLFKEVEASNANEDDEQIFQYIREMNAALPTEMNGVTFLSIELDEALSSVIYKYAIHDVDVSQMTEETNSLLVETLKPELLSAFNEDVANNTVIKRLAQNGYNFVYKYCDDNREQLFEIVLTPDDYQEALK